MKKIFTLLLFLMATVAWGGNINAANTQCAGTSTVTTQADPLTEGYDYTFTTSGTDVTVTFKLLDQRVGLEAYLWNQTIGLLEHRMTDEGNQTFSYTLTGQDIGSDIKISCKFAYAGGMTVTDMFTYTVGETCGTSTDTEAPTSFTATLGTVGSNSVELLLNATDNSGAVIYTISGTGGADVKVSGASGTQKTATITGLTPATPYTFSITAKDAAGNTAANSPLSVLATTTTLAIPITGAPAPPALAAAKVISIFSDAFTAIPGTTDFNPNWGQSTQVVSGQIAGNNTLKYTNLNYQGTAFGSDVNASTMEYLHVDVWTPNETSLEIFCISRTTGERSYQLTPLTLNSWNSYEIPLSAFTDQGMGITDLFQFKIVGSGGKIVYLDNLYFYTTSTAVDTEKPTNFTATVGNIMSDGIELLLNATDDSNAVTYTITYGSELVNVPGISGSEKSYIVGGLTPATPYTFSISVKDATGNVAANAPLTVSATTKAALPGAPVPTHPSSAVVSIFSDTYTSAAASANFYPGWGQSTIASAAVLSGNNTMKYTNFNYQGIELGTSVDASAMDKLHVDIYPVDETVIRITPISPGKEFSITLSPLNLNEWNSFDITLSDFTGVDKADVIQFKLDGGTGKTFYMDNLYFFNSAYTSIDEIENNKDVTCYLADNNLVVAAKSSINKVVVYNLAGQVVKVVSVNALENTTDLTSIPSGSYLVSISLEDGSLTTKKIIKF